VRERCEQGSDLWLVDQVLDGLQRGPHGVHLAVLARGLR